MGFQTKQKKKSPDVELKGIHYYADEQSWVSLVQKHVMPMRWLSQKLYCHLMKLEPRRLQRLAAELERKAALMYCHAKTPQLHLK